MKPFLKRFGKGIAELLIIIMVSIVLAKFLQPYINTDALYVLVNIYSILAGFLVGVIALIGDPTTMPSGDWVQAERSLKNTMNRLKGTRNLLYVYLMTLFLIFIYKMGSVGLGIDVLNSLGFEDDSESIINSVKNKTEFFILFFAFVALFYSFKLPSKLFAIQQFRVEEEIKRRRRQDNIED